MRTSKYLAVLALAAPFATLSAQSATSELSPDSSASHSRAGWVAAGATGGAAFFAAILRGSHSGTAGASPFITQSSGPATNGFTPTSGTPSIPAAGPIINGATDGAGTTPTGSTSSTTTTTDNTPTTDNTTTPDDVTTPANTPTDDGINNEVPGMVNNDSPPNGDDSPPIFTPTTPDEPGPGDSTVVNPDADTPSTVPEPASLALLATGLVGMAPFARRRK